MSADDLTVEQIAMAVEQGRLSNSLYEKLIRHHQNSFKRRENKYETKVWPKLKNSFKNELADLIKKYNLPLTDEVINRRLAEVKIRLVDGASAIRDNIVGKHDADNNEILFNFDAEDVNYRHIIFHELTHLLSGRTLNLRTAGEVNKVQFGRRGLKFNETRGKKNPPISLPG